MGGDDETVASMQEEHMSNDDEDVDDEEGEVQQDKGDDKPVEEEVMRSEPETPRRPLQRLHTGTREGASSGGGSSELHGNPSKSLGFEILVVLSLPSRKHNVHVKTP